MALSHQIRSLITPALIVLAVAALAALQYFKIIDVTTLTPPTSPEFQKFSADLPSIALAFLFGAMGAFVKISMGAGALAERLRRLISGGVVGVVVFFILKSKVIPQIMYDNLPDKGLEVSYYGLALLAVFGGMYASELTSWASRRG